MRDRIDGVLIEVEENGFHLFLSGEDREYNFTLDHNAALALSTAVAAELSPWIRELQTEGISERMDRLAREDTGYSPDDPKHPMYHETTSELWDNREK